MPSREARPNVFFGALGRQSDSPWTAANEEIALGNRLHTLPFQKNGLRTALTAHDTDRLFLNDLRLGVDAGSCSVAEPFAHHLREVEHELVVSLKLVVINPDRGAII